MKKILSLILILAMTVSLAACGTDPVTPDGSETTPADTTPIPARTICPT